MKIEIDFQRHKDDLQRLEQEYSRITDSANSAEVEKQPHDARTIAKTVKKQAEDPQEKKGSGDRKCMICLKDEVSILFVPCKHQVLCANCITSIRKKGKARCPCCRVPIEESIHVYGASS